ncbi:uncharacterized protein LY89DRAFT_741387 [Mollisia scopiformis]|uniref:Mitotic apparatus protein p62 n=1 Tax=Mollisia scopiformis TaxID=149040 RepID=A0A132B9P2_MOLSC|nr:uncharacterized protein LY89DRAFT_741387 [Mollisia scopiformis]KUJ09091.1 hypothetical protein LY89DRAFT_741387 [Mollisia scopiformis]
MLLRLPRLDLPSEEDAFVLVHVSSAGPHPLDVKLIGTDNENAFAVSLNSSQTLKLRHKTSKLNEAQWDYVLSVILLGAAQGEEDPALLEDVEAVAKVEEDTLVVIIRRTIEGITQPLGSISLSKDDDEGEDIDLFEWCGVANKAKDTSNDELQSLRTTLGSKDEEIRKLQDSLAELTQLKNDNETQLLEKFSLLLNEKKLKIRDQQRLLACSNVDPAKLAEVEASREPVSLHSPGPSRKGKRKAKENIESDDSDAGFEKMEVDDAPAEESEGEEQAQTPDDSTADEAESDDEPPAPPIRRAAASTKGKETATIPADEDPILPPKRDLPFNGKPAAASKPEPTSSSSKTAAADDGSETDSDDDEL